MGDGYSHYKIDKLVESGELAKVNRRYYENLAYSGEPNDFYAATACSDKGVIFLLERGRALRSVLRKAREGRRGPSQADADPGGSGMAGHEVLPLLRATLRARAENRERARKRLPDLQTVCDVLFYRNKLSFVPAVEVVRAYMRRRDRDLNRLMAYAAELREKTVMRQFVEMLA